MKKYMYVALVALVVVTAFGVLLRQNRRLRLDRDTYRTNTETLLGEVERYETKSGQQAVRIGELQLRIGELEKYRAEDAALIRDMGIKRQELEQLTKLQQETIYSLRGQVRDTVYIDTGPDGSGEKPVKCAEYSDEWLDFSCTIFDEIPYRPLIKTRNLLTYAS